MAEFSALFISSVRTRNIRFLKKPIWYHWKNIYVFAHGRPFALILYVLLEITNEVDSAMIV